MDHREYIRHIPGSTRAVLLIHGIAGTPAHFRDLVPCIPEDWSVYNILLDGHGAGVREFGASSMKKWKAQAADTVKTLLERHEKIVIIAHSMGTLFAIRAAVDHSDRVAGLFLLAVPTRPWVRLSTVHTCLRAIKGNIDPEDTAALALVNDSSIQLEPNIFRYISWLPRMVELLGEICRVRKLLPRLAVPCMSFQSHTDELVSIRSRKDLERAPCVRNHVLYGSGHFCYGTGDTRLLQSRLEEFLRTL